MKIGTQHPHSLLFVLAFTVVSCSNYEKEEIVIEPGTSIHHDDFEYSVTDYSIRRSLGSNDDTVITEGNLYIVTFSVVNNAKRVNHDWDNSLAFMVDENGNIYENKVELQKKLQAIEPFGFKEAYITPFQSQESTRFVFELPASIKEPYLKVRGETLMGDFLDGNQFERTKVKLY